MPIPRSVLALLLILFAIDGAAGEAAPIRVLFFTKSAGFEHSVIKRAPGAKSHAMKQLDAWTAAGGFTYDETKDGDVFTPENIARYDVFMFYTTGDLTSEKPKDGSKPMTREGKALFLDAIAQGKGLVGVHSASDTCHSGSTRGAHAYRDDRGQLDPYIAMLGGEFIAHGKQQTMHSTCHDGQWPGIGAASAGFDLHEEWYALKNFAPDLHVVFTLDPAADAKEIMYQRPPYPHTWARMHGKGRVFYTAKGHREDVWTTPLFRDLVVSAIGWAAGRIPADATANIDQAAPKAHDVGPGRK